MAREMNDNKNYTFCICHKFVTKENRNNQHNDQLIEMINIHSEYGIVNVIELTKHSVCHTRKIKSIPIEIAEVRRRGLYWGNEGKKKEKLY